MFQEPFEDRYNDLLKKRVALEGQLALLRLQADTERAKVRSKNKLSLFLLLILAFLCLIYGKKRYITPLEQKIALQQDSMTKLKNEITIAQKVKKDSIRYVIRKGDMLITLGHLFFNDPAQGYQIGIDNGISSKQQQYNLTPGDTLTIHYR